MTKEANGNSNKPPEPVDLKPPENTPGCGSDCDCNKPSGNGNRMIKIAVCLVVAVAVGAILLFKMGMVSGGITETNLMQAYVASTRGGDCGAGCGPKGCPTNAAPAAAPSKK